MSEKQKYDLASSAADRFYELQRKIGAVYAFAFRSYAVKVTDCKTYFGLGIYDREGRFITNIAC